MKKTIILVLVLSLSLASFSQETKALKTLTREQYLKKGRHQNTAAWLCLALGTGSILLARAVTPDGYNWDYDVNTPQEDRQAKLGVALLWTGLGSLFSSIPLFLASRRNKREGMSLSFKNDKNRQLKNSSLTSRAVPTLTLKISL